METKKTHNHKSKSKESVLLPAASQYLTVEIEKLSTDAVLQKGNAFMGVAGLAGRRQGRRGSFGNISVGEPHFQISL